MCKTQMYEMLSICSRRARFKFSSSWETDKMSRVSAFESRKSLTDIEFNRTQCNTTSVEWFHNGGYIIVLHTVVHRLLLVASKLDHAANNTTTSLAEICHPCSTVGFCDPIKHIYMPKDNSPFSNMFAFFCSKTIFITPVPTKMKVILFLIFLWRYLDPNFVARFRLHIKSLNWSDGWCRPSSAKHVIVQLKGWGKVKPPACIGREIVWVHQHIHSYINFLPQDWHRYQYAMYPKQKQLLGGRSGERCMVGKSGTFHYPFQSAEWPNLE